MMPYSQFRFCNAVLQAPPSMPECLPLAIHRTADGERCISCWRPSWRERISILLFGKVWLDCFSGPTQPPVALTGTKEYLRADRRAAE